MPNVATCKETFNLYYYETDRDEATSTFPPWNEAAYTKVRQKCARACKKWRRSGYRHRYGAEGFGFCSRAY